FQAEDGIRDWSVTGVQTCALPIYALIAQIDAKQTEIARSTQKEGRDLKKSEVAYYYRGVAKAIRARQSKQDGNDVFFDSQRLNRSEERRVGKECRSGGARKQRIDK